MVPGTKVPGNYFSFNSPGNAWSAEGRSAGFTRSRKRKFPGRMVPGTKVPGNKWSREQKFHHGNECSRERIVLRANVPAFRIFLRCFWNLYDVDEFAII